MTLGVAFKRLCAIGFLLALAACGGTPAEAPGRPEPAGLQPSMYRSLAHPGAAVDAEAAQDMISQYRRNSGFGPLELSEKLQEIANERAREMARRGSTERDARAFLKSRLHAAGEHADFAAENVSAGYDTLAEAFSGWRQSAQHNARMLEPRARKMGLATAYAPGSKYKIFWALILTD
jgi:uncharacterized protein YkwD